MIDTRSKKRGGVWALYVRESTEGQLANKDYNSLQSQVDYLRKFVAAEDGEVYQVYSDVASGRKEREGLQRLVNDGVARHFNYAVAYELDRWSRDVPIFVRERARLKRAGVTLVSASQDFGDSAEAELMEGQFAYFAQYFSELTSRKVKLKREAMAAKGMWPGGRPPFGYTLVNKKLVPVDAEAEIVRLIFTLFDEHPSRAGVRTRLEELGLSNRGGRKWTNTSLEHLLRNPVYAGTIRQNDLQFPGNHAALVDPATFEATQKRCPTSMRLRHKNDHEYPLTGVLVCGSCGSSMTPYYVPRPTTDVRYYRCTLTFRAGWNSCPIKYVNARRIERAIASLVDDLVASPTLVEESIARANESTAAAQDPLSQRERALQAQLKGLEAQETNLVDAIVNGGMGDVASVKARLVSIASQKTTVTVELRTTSEQLRTTRRSIIEVARVRAALSDMRLLYEIATEKERGELVRLLFKQIRLQGRKGPMEAELFDHDAAVFEGGSKIRTARLREQDSNLRPIG